MHKISTLLLSSFVMIPAAYVGCTGATAATHDISDVTQRIVRVQTGDLDLQSPSDQKALDRRIRAASGIVCRDFSNPSDLFAVSRCITEARLSAKTQRDRLVARASEVNELQARSCFMPANRAAFGVSFSALGACEEFIP